MIMNTRFNTFIFVVLCWAIASFGKDVIAVINLENTGGVSNGTVKEITSSIYSSVKKLNKHIVLEKKIVDTLLVAQGFSATNKCSQEQCLTAMGHLISVKKIIGGSIERKKAKTVVTLLYVDVNSSKQIHKITRAIEGPKEQFLTSVLPEMVRNLVSVEKRRPLIARPVLWVPTTVLAAGGAAALLIMNNSSGSANGHSNEDSHVVTMEGLPIRQR